MKISNPLVGFTVSFLLIPNFLFGNQDQDGIEAGIETENQEQINEETDNFRIKFISKKSIINNLFRH